MFDCGDSLRLLRIIHDSLPLSLSFLRTLPKIVFTSLYDSLWLFLHDCFLQDSLRLFFCDSLFRTLHDSYRLLWIFMTLYSSFGLFLTVCDTLWTCTTLLISLLISFDLFLVPIEFTSLHFVEGAHKSWQLDWRAGAHTSPHGCCSCDRQCLQRRIESMNHPVDWQFHFEFYPVDSSLSLWAIDGIQFWICHLIYPEKSHESYELCFSYEWIVLTCTHWFWRCSTLAGSHLQKVPVAPSQEPLGITWRIPIQFESPGCKLKTRSQCGVIDHFSEVLITSSFRVFFPRQKARLVDNLKIVYDSWVIFRADLERSVLIKDLSSLEKISNRSGELDNLMAQASTLWFLVLRIACVCWIMLLFQEFGAT